MTTKEKNLGGRLTLEEQAIKDHTKLETRIDLAMSKATPKLLKHFLHMVDNIATQKDTIQMKLIEKGMGHNKEFMKAFREALDSTDKKDTIEEQEDYEIAISLTSSDSESKTLN